MGNLRAKSEGEPREPIPAGTYLGVICGVYDLGTQPGGQYDPRHQILVRWELHKRKGPLRNKAGNVQTTSNFYTLSFSEKANLRRDVEAMLGKSFTDDEAKLGFDVEELLGKSCRLQIAHEAKPGGGIRDYISAIMALDEDDDEPRGELGEDYYEIGPDRSIPDEVPDWIKKQIRKSKEFGGAAAKAAPANGSHRTAAPVGAPADEDDDIPF